ncbi:zf-HC2 domain-containing protein [Spirulina sp. CS-785/01]|uniref:anti-sigma factor family protein n=1 Tax=Spirulina sp. CS-785/01 TaxID=3021716 RepID=UPI00232D8FD6|nr:zf-HC2 domain-containing protein [Spirulina sp. CS-785/01]MDB9314346.1 zf-HC2 domain-containing protein [Spirulina sp. CS-785/01]
MKFQKFSHKREQNSVYSDQYHLEDKTEFNESWLMNGIKRDRFELLSAYLDGETSPQERRQVETWLSEDPNMQQMYRRLLQLRRGLHTLPIPDPQTSAEEMAEQVYATVKRRQSRRVAAWGGTAIAAAVVGVVALFAPNNASLFPRMAETPENEPAIATSSDDLMLAVNQPVVEIPPVEDELNISLDRPILAIPKDATSEDL